MPHESLTKTLYTTTATATGGREGHVTSEDGVIDLDTGKPGSKANPKANPETFLAAGYASCLGNAVLTVGKRMDVDVSTSSVTAAVSLGATETGVAIAVALTVHLPGLDQEAAQAVADAAHAACPFSKAISGNVDVAFTVDAA